MGQLLEVAIALLYRDNCFLMQLRDNLPGIIRLCCLGFLATQTLSSFKHDLFLILLDRKVENSIVIIYCPCCAKQLNTSIVPNLRDYSKQATYMTDPVHI